MKNKLLAILILIIFSSCKSTKEVKNNKLDINSLKSKKIENSINLTELKLDEDEITLISANPLKPIVITDSNGNVKKFNNVKSVNLKSKKKIKKDSTVSKKLEANDKLIDKSKIDEDLEVVSDAVQYKSIAKYGTFSLLFLLIIYLVFKFKK